MIDLEYANQAFDTYLQQFPVEQDRIKLKIIHTKGVVDCAERIATGKGLSEEDCQLAKLIALLHDIGRFEQAMRYDSFEPATMDHATFGVQLLFEQGMIRQFIKEETWDDIIREAIARHSSLEVGEIEDDRTLLHARLIRDADKLDNCRVKLEESLQVLLGMEAEEVGKLPITDVIWETCLKEQSVRSADRVTRMDYWVSYVAYFFDINFPATFQIIQKEHYVDRIIDRIPYTNPDTKAKMEELRAHMNRYVQACTKN